METLRILERPEGIVWDYDEEADVVYLSIGGPRAAGGVDIGEGVVVRYDEGRRDWPRAGLDCAVAEAGWFGFCRGVGHETTRGGKEAWP